MLCLSSHTVIDERHVERRKSVSINWMLVALVAVSAALLLVLLLGAGVLIWLLRRSASKKA